MSKYKANYKALIEPYKLGKITTNAFLDNLATIFYFLSEVPRETRDEILSSAWNSSISLDDETEKRILLIIEKSKTQPVYLVLNTNELNMMAILKIFQERFPAKCREGIDISIKDSQEPVEVMPNIYLCLSYRYCAFKDGNNSTASLLEQLHHKLPGEMSVVSQFQPDLDKAKEMGVDYVEADDFYTSNKVLSLR